VAAIGAGLEGVAGCLEQAKAARLRIRSKINPF
jgi:hypothetical protein